MPTFVQGVGTGTRTGAGTATPGYQFASNVTAGNSIIVGVSWNTATGSVTSVTDTQGNTYSPLTTLLVGSSLLSGQVFWCPAVASTGSLTVTCNLSAAETSSSVDALEFSGVANVTDGTNKLGATVTNHNVTSGTITTTNANDLLYGYTRGGAITAGESGWTTPEPAVGRSQYLSVSATGTYAATWTISDASAPNVAFIVALEAAGNPSPSVSAHPISNLNSSSVTLNGSIDATGSSGNSTVEGFNWGTTTGYGNTASASGSFSTGSFSQNITGLTPGVTYHYRSFATNPGGTGTSADQTFTVPSFTNGEVRFNGSQISGGTVSSGTLANLNDADNSTSWITSTSGSWAGVDAGNYTNLTRVRITPVPGNEDLSNGLQIQGSNDPTFSSGAVTLFTTSSTPQSEVLTNEYDISSSFYFRYFRILSPSGVISLSDLDFIGNFTSGVSAACADPTMTPPGGVYDKPVKVRLASITTGTSIFYTTDGTTPTTGSNPYTGPIVVGTDGTVIRSISTLAGLSNSRVTFTPGALCNSDNSSPGIFHISNDIVPGKQRYDSNRGYRMVVSEGLILKDPVSGFWYEYGAHAEGIVTGQSWNMGANVYKSSDLRNWSYAGNICAPSSSGVSGSPGTTATNQEHFTPTFHRHQVLYNAANNNYVCWTGDFFEGATTRYHRVWTSPNPTGPFTLVNTFTTGIGGTTTTGLDHGTFVDPIGGQAYLMWVSNGSGGTQSSVYIAKLNSTYTDVITGAGNMVGTDFGSNGSNWRESPTMFYRNGVYFWITSTQTGVGYNLNGYQTASSPLGPWGTTWTSPFQSSSIENPATSYRSQSLQVIKIPGRDDGTGQGAFVYMGNRNYSEQTPVISYNTDMIFLPVVFPTNTSMTISWDIYATGYSFDGLFPTVSGAPLAAT